MLSCLSAVQPGCCEHMYVLNEKCCPSGIVGRISVIQRRRIKTHLFKSSYLDNFKKLSLFSELHYNDDL